MGCCLGYEFGNLRKVKEGGGEGESRGEERGSGERGRGGEGERGRGGEGERGGGSLRYLKGVFSTQVPSTVEGGLT